MAILNYTTTIDLEKSISEIQKCLTKTGLVDKIVTDYSNGIPSSLTFCINLKGNVIGFSLPANFKGVLNAMEKNKAVPRNKCNEKQAQRVAWRILKDWVEAQMAIVEAEIAELSEVFLPYAILKNGNTLYQDMKGNEMKLLK